MPRTRFLVHIALALACAVPAAALAQFRNLPKDAKRGHIRHLQAMLVAIDGTTMRLAPGAQIRGPNNLIVLPTALPDGALIKYTVDGEGMVKQVWILSPQEAAQPDANR